jgi:hypothetical protein
MRDTLNREDMYIVTAKDATDSSLDSLEDTPRLDDAVKLEMSALRKQYNRDQQGIRQHIRQARNDMRTFGYPNVKIEKHVIEIQMKKGLKKQDSLFERIG